MALYQGATSVALTTFYQGTTSQLGEKLCFGRALYQGTTLHTAKKTRLRLALYQGLTLHTVEKLDSDWLCIRA